MPSSNMRIKSRVLTHDESLTPVLKLNSSSRRESVMGIDSKLAG